MNLFLDDERKPLSVTWVKLPLVAWTIVRSYDDFRAAIKKHGVPDFVAYDHDLGVEAYTEANRKKFLAFDYSNLKEKTGMDCAKSLIRTCMDQGFRHPPYVVHSMNPIGKENIEGLIEGYNRSFSVVRHVTQGEPADR